MIAVVVAAIVGTVAALVAAIVRAATAPTPRPRHARRGLVVPRDLDISRLDRMDGIGDDQ